MYLYRAPNNVYFTRICLAKSLRDIGYPFDVKVSLLTRDRSEAVIRNIDVAGTLKKLIKSIDEHTRINDFIRYVDEVINQLRTQFVQIDRPSSIIPQRQSKITPAREVESLTPPKPQICFNEVLTQFVASKHKAGIRLLSVKQLTQRIEHFITFTSATQVTHITSADAMQYRDTLLTQGRSYKSNKEYLAATFQFFKWCKLMNYCTQNPFKSVTIGQKPKAKASDARDRWSTLELKRLFDSAEYRVSDDDFKWVTVLMLYSGLRPSEACQLRISDIKSVNDSTYIAISEGGQGQRLKNINAVREVPIHANLLKRGFMAFVASRAHQNGQLFGYKQVGQTEDWSYQYCKQLSTLQTKIGMKPNARPTAAMVKVLMCLWCKYLFFS
ncbi:hypothetical protein [Shewanella glacialipiscicola]|uniref:hypothetical protein n=5 Tax=Shewanella glacialipiscicola TaxID=614069 RepID=UPI003D79394D